MKQTKIEIIFDRDHGTQNYGWYSRTTDADGQQSDDSCDTAWALDPEVSDAQIRAWSSIYFGDVDGMTDQARQELADSVIIRR